MPTDQPFNLVSVTQVLAISGLVVFISYHLLPNYLDKIEWMTPMARKSISLTFPGLTLGLISY